jgi:23S rRNA (guanosine2251-2'-O)-methyltransferase
MKKEVYLVLHNIRSRENVGSVFRTADGAGVGKIYLCGITPTPPHEKISKTALGAETFVPWEYHKQTWRLLKNLKAQGVKLIALEQTKDAVDIFKLKALDFKPLALILGNEIKGLSPQILEYCDKKISIPMYGKKESLNVSVAAGVALYQLFKR